MSSPLVITFSTPAIQTLSMPRPAPAVTAGVPAALASAWEQTLDAWQQPTRHDTVLGLAAKHEQFAWLAARYREIAKRNPDDPIPPARLARLQRAMLVTFRFDAKQPAPRAKTPYRGAAVLLVVSVFATVLGLWVVDMKSREYHRNPSHAASKVTSNAK